MKITLADVERHRQDAEVEGNPVSITGIPDGFAFKQSNLIIGDVVHEGSYFAYVPLSDWTTVYGKDEEELLAHYQEEAKKNEKADH